MSLLVSDAITDLKQETTTVSSRISDTTWYLLLNRANKYFMRNYLLPTTETETDLLVYPNVFEYASPAGFMGFIQPKRPYLQENVNFVHSTQNEFLHSVEINKTAIKFNRETQYFLVQGNSTSPLNIHTMDSLTSNGTWSVSGDGSSLVLDEQIFQEGVASLKFTITGAGGTTTLTNSTLNRIDLTDYKDVGRLFLNLQCPTTNTANLTSVRLRVGSDSTNYYEMTATLRHRGDSIGTGWGIISFDFTSYTTTGSPVITAIDYAQILITHGVAGINGSYRVDSLFAGNPTYYQLPYYSLYNVKSNSGTYQEKVSASTDTILCPAGFEEALIYKTIELASIYKLKDQNLTNYALAELKPIEESLKRDYPSQKAKIQSRYY